MQQVRRTHSTPGSLNPDRVGWGEALRSIPLLPGGTGGPAVAGLQHWSLLAGHNQAVGAEQGCFSTERLSRDPPAPTPCKA